MGHIDLRLVKLFIYQSFVTLHFLGFFHWTVFNLFFFVPYLLGDSETGSIQGPLQPRPQGLLAFQYGKREDPGDEVGASALRV